MPRFVLSAGDGGVATCGPVYVTGCNIESGNEVAVAHDLLYGTTAGMSVPVHVTVTDMTEAILFDATQNASDLYAIVNNVTWGGAPLNVQTWWGQKGCSASPRCQDINELYGLSPTETLGGAPSYVINWWQNQGCNTQPLFTSDACQRAADTFAAGSPGMGFAPPSVQAFWTSQNCSSHPRDNQRRSFGNGPLP